MSNVLSLPDHLSKHAMQILLSQRELCTEYSRSHTHYHSSVHDVREASAESCDPVAWDSLRRAGWHQQQSKSIHTQLLKVPRKRGHKTDVTASSQNTICGSWYIWYLHWPVSSWSENLGSNAEFSFLQHMMNCICICCFFFTECDCESGHCDMHTGECLPEAATVNLCNISTLS